MDAHDQNRLHPALAPLTTPTPPSPAPPTYMNTHVAPFPFTPLQDDARCKGEAGPLPLVLFQPHLTTTYATLALLFHKTLLPPPQLQEKGIEDEGTSTDRQALRHPKGRTRDWPTNETPLAVPKRCVPCPPIPSFPFRPSTPAWPDPLSSYGMKRAHIPLF